MTTTMPTATATTTHFGTSALRRAVLWLLRLLMFVCGLAWLSEARAAFPAAYAPMDIEPVVSATGQHEFDLRPTQQRARR